MSKAKTLNELIEATIRNGYEATDDDVRRLTYAIRYADYRDDECGVGISGAQASEVQSALLERIATPQPSLNLDIAGMIAIEMATDPTEDEDR